MSIQVVWQELFPLSEDARWGYTNCLYAYISPRHNEILYIGKANGCSVRQRWNASDKKINFWQPLEEQRGIYEHITLLGEIYLEIGRRFSRQLLSDIESLLIAYEQPWGNSKCRKSRISRPSMEIKCYGDWVGSRRRYIDY